MEDVNLGQSDFKIWDPSTYVNHGPGQGVIVLPNKTFLMQLCDCFITINTRTSLYWVLSTAAHTLAHKTIKPYEQGGITSLIPHMNTCLQTLSKLSKKQIVSGRAWSQTHMRRTPQPFLSLSGYCFCICHSWQFCVNTFTITITILCEYIYYWEQKLPGCPFFLDLVIQPPNLGPMTPHQLCGHLWF